MRWNNLSRWAPTRDSTAVEPLPVASSAAWQAQGWILRTGETFSTAFRYLGGITRDGENQAVPGTASTSLS